MVTGEGPLSIPTGAFGRWFDFYSLAQRERERERERERGGPFSVDIGENSFSFVSLVLLHAAEDREVNRDAEEA